VRIVRLLLTGRWILILGLAIGAAIVASADLVVRYVHRPAAGVLAVVAGRPITLQTFQQEVQRRGGEAAFVTPEQRRALLDEMIRVEVLASNAQQAGYLNNPEVRRAIDQILADKYEKVNIDAPLAQLQVADSEVEEYYRDNIVAYTTAEASHAAVIFIAVPANASDDEKHTLGERAEHVHQLATAKPGGPNFGALASQYSDDEDTRAQDGDIGWLVEGQENPRWEPVVVKSVFDLDNPGDVSRVVTTGKGFYVIKLLENRPASLQPLTEVRASIRQQLIRAQRQHGAAKLYAAALSNVDVSVSEAGVAAMEAAEKAIVDVPHGAPAQPKG